MSDPLTKGMAGGPHPTAWSGPAGEVFRRIRCHLRPGRAGVQHCDRPGQGRDRQTAPPGLRSGYITNLHRQQYKAHQIGQYKTEALAETLREIAPYLSIEMVTEQITENNLASLLDGVDVVCEAFDAPEAKAMLVNGVLEQFPSVYLVAASGMAGMGTPNTIRTRKITKRFYLCGDGTSDTADTIGLVAPRVMVCAAHQAHTVLRILAGEFDV